LYKTNENGRFISYSLPRNIRIFAFIISECKLRLTLAAVWCSSPC